MPELPEVETITNHLKPILQGRSFSTITTHTPTLRYPIELSKDRLLGIPIRSVWRRAKYIIWELDNLECLVIHLGMTGGFHLQEADYRTGPHDRLEFCLDNGKLLYFQDPRKFGFIRQTRLSRHGESPAILPPLGVEPLSDHFTQRQFATLLQGRRGPIKSTLLDQRVVAGMGNIYASEALFHAQIHPAVPTNTLSSEATGRLHRAIRKVLRKAIHAGGTTFRDYHQLDGTEGKFTADLQVYNREGLSCYRCTATIQRLVISGRSSFFCPGCQPAPHNPDSAER
ncbi:MAG: bifunctional DNA-formamidopyrimidine glycosylase/DNA-(apurinic or apyrimidinic site) lyase [Lentisphaerae bacterium]|nr:MAG: bifunctional DNA-formamidopyrimidine glycosylase/DNA-(apurinic or apyrimidinic site) lyase [Lentisphaerota bacterium]